MKFEKEDEGVGPGEWTPQPRQQIFQFKLNTQEDHTGYVRDLINRQFVISRILRPDGTISMADAEA